MLNNIGLIGLVILIIPTGFLLFLGLKKSNNLIQRDSKGLEIKTGLGGWLTLVGFNIVLSVLYALVVFFTYLMILIGGTSTDLLILISEFIVNTAFLLFGSYLIILFFKKKKLFRKLYAYYISLTFLWVLVDGIAVTWMLSEIQNMDSETLYAIARNGVWFVIFLPYILRSKRVKFTFVN